MSIGLLSLLVFSPLLGIIVLAFMQKTNEKAIKTVGFLATLVPLLLSFIAYSKFDFNNKSIQLAEKVDWISFNLSGDFPFVVNYELGLTGLSLVLILLTTVVATLAAVASIYIKSEWKGFFMLFLLLELGMLGVFAAQNTVLFFIFFEITLIPTFFLVGKWGYEERVRAAYNFLLYNGFGSAILLIVFALLFAKTGTANIEELKTIMAADQNALSTIGITPEFKMGILIALLVAFGVKLPIFPLHTWMLRVHAQAPIATVMIHSGILLKIGAYGLITFGFNLFPAEFERLAVLIAVLGVINLLYGAFLALIQKDFKMVLAYSSISHMGVVLIGLGAMNVEGVQGAIFQVISHGLISALLFFIVGIMYERTGTTTIDALGGLAKVMPLASGFFLAGAMASLGLPGMSGFVSEFMAFLGLFKSMPVVAAVGCLGIILTAAYLLRAVLNITFGPTSTRFTGVKDISSVEYLPVVVLLAFIILIGVYPNVLTSAIAVTIETITVGIGG
ncbi:complex I subunit 4 family protein [Calidifontibacillus erzurumensis]|uniref:NADH-quinone oxidoreductase subunit M n=1 Tax=Calidifontibacillus erzurumensis TaxID=2741433 RepID=A0A8J8GGP6_9BACI|nr:NADH-quinone oxidoreductase subunit M [Calidifontibacillus erzurumensis]NSL52068.1 NADH-quinone oxidoreductase subunit M [Calidifontibacillus erzurumensis]